MIDYPKEYLEMLSSNSKSILDKVITKVQPSKDKEVKEAEGLDHKVVETLNQIQHEYSLCSRVFVC